MASKGWNLRKFHHNAGTIPLYDSEILNPFMFKYFRSIWGMFQTFCWNCLLETFSNNPFHKGIPNIQTSNLPLPGDSIRDL